MKHRIFLLSLMFLISQICKSQIYLPMYPTTYGLHTLRDKADSARHIPEKTILARNTNDTTAQIFLNKNDSSVWAYYKPKGFFKIGGGDVGIGNQLYTDTSTYDATRWWVNNYAPNIGNTDLKINTNRTLDVNGQNFTFYNIGPSLGFSFTGVDGFYFSANEFPDFRYGWYDAVSSRGAFEYSALKNKSYIYDGYTQIGLNDEGTYPVLRIGKTPYTNANGRIRLVSADAADSIEIENTKGSFVLSRMASSRDTLIRAKYDSITLKGKLFDKNIQAGAGTKAVRWNSSTGEFTYADTTAGGGGGWSLTGNAGTNPASNFIGTTDGQPLMFRYNNQNAGSIGKEGMHTYLGIEAGENDVSGGDPNIGIGSYVLSSNTTGDGNSAVGGFVLGNNTAGYYNSAVGVSALYSNTTGYYNSAVGVSALYSNTTGYYNLAVGISALGSNTTGDYNSAVGKSAGWNINQKPDAKYQNLFGANTYGTRDSITVIGANFIKETIVRGKLIDSTLSAGAGTKAVRWNEATGEFTYADTTVGGGGTPAGSNKELQFNNSGSFGGTTGIKYGNATNERLSIWQQSSSDVPLTIRTAGDNSKAAIEIKDTTNQPYTSAIKFSPSPVGSPQPSKIYQGYEGLYLDGGSAPYTTAGGATVVIGNSTGGLAPFKVHSYPYDVPASPNNWVAKIRTSKTSAVGLAIDWGAAGQTGDLLQFRDNSAAVLASVTSAGNIKAPAPTYSSGGYKFLVRNSTSSQFESIDPLVGSATYTPTTSGLTNVDSTHVFECQYSWITDATTGLKTVTVSGQVEVYINSANTDSRVILSLPVASSFANEYEAGGSGGVTSASNGLSNHRYSIGVKANTISEAAEFVFNPTSGSCNAKINFSFHYKVNPS